MQSWSILTSQDEIKFKLPNAVQEFSIAKRRPLLVHMQPQSVHFCYSDDMSFLKICLKCRSGNALHSAHKHTLATADRPIFVYITIRFALASIPSPAAASTTSLPQHTVNV